MSKGKCQRCQVYSSDLEMYQYPTTRKRLCPVCVHKELLTQQTFQRTMREIHGRKP